MPPVSGPHFENWSNCYQGWEKLKESEERKATTGKIENHWKGKEHSKDKIHTSPRNCPDCVYVTKLLSSLPLTACFLSASSWADPSFLFLQTLYHSGCRAWSQAASLQIRSPVTSVPLLALYSICWQSPSLAQTSPDSKTPRSSCLPDVSLWWITGISD